MKQIIKSLIPLLTLFVIISCDESKKEPEKNQSEIRQEKQDKLDTLNLNEANKLSISSHAIIGWDTTKHFTYSLQELFENGTRPISFIGRIKDIVKKDTFYILKVTSSNSPSDKNFIAEISITANILSELKAHLDPNEDNEGCFIFQVTKISSSIPILKSEIETSGDNVEDASSYLTLDFNETLIRFQGELLTYYLYNQIKEDNE